jgi:hypothetical protein
MEKKENKPKRLAMLTCSMLPAQKGLEAVNVQEQEDIPDHHKFRLFTTRYTPIPPLLQPLTSSPVQCP